jgi:hypothetical protein
VIFIVDWIRENGPSIGIKKIIAFVFGQEFKRRRPKRTEGLIAIGAWKPFVSLMSSCILAAMAIAYVSFTVGPTGADWLKAPEWIQLLANPLNPLFCLTTACFCYRCHIGKDVLKNISD